ncbi:MAG TPA: type II toxin-antitoxin system prevent-host-death family antitoxin [Blastocatellia bacterium]|nr:type II toxin-antitoxin system prevent-host-death family antitoxin [Blastocatellia bacterium]
MAIQTTYTKARANLAKLCTRVAEDREIVIINRRGADDVALVSADELASLTETAHLLRSPKNAKRLLTALNRARKKTIKPKSLTQLRREMRLEEKG